MISLVVFIRLSAFDIQYFILSFFCSFAHSLFPSFVFGRARLCVLCCVW